MKTESKSSHDDMSLNELFQVLLRDWKIIFFSVLVASLISISYSLSLYNQYKSKTLLVPNSLTASFNAGGDSLGGGLSALAGVNLGSSKASNEVLIALEVIESQKFITDFVNKNNILIDLMAAKGWDKNSNSLVINKDIYDQKNNLWLDGKPTSFEIFESFSDRLSISQDKKTSLVSISIEYYSPYMATDWLVLMVHEINEHMKKRKLKVTYKNLANLQESLASSNLNNTSDSISRLIYEQQRIKMVSETASEYIFETVNSPILPEKKSKPSRSIIVLISAFMAAMMSIFWILFRQITK